MTMKVLDENQPLMAEEEQQRAIVIGDAEEEEQHHDHDKCGRKEDSEISREHSGMESHMLHVVVACMCPTSSLPLDSPPSCSVLCPTRPKGHGAGPTKRHHGTGLCTVGFTQPLIPPSAIKERINGIPSLPSSNSTDAKSLLKLTPYSLSHPSFKKTSCLSTLYRRTFSHPFLRLTAKMVHLSTFLLALMLVITGLLSYSSNAAPVVAFAPHPYSYLYNALTKDSSCTHSFILFCKQICALFYFARYCYPSLCKLVFLLSFS
ncbi:hypothetical protein BC829DRAFT_397265 [Chytridium lagenaria]|nr:hypothetical protein BC829DRAFT_397265 [Chytridium lagenaria]